MPGPTLFEIIREYVSVIFHYWWALLPGLVMPLRNMYRWFHPKHKELEIPHWVRLGSVVVALFLAQFLAYRNSAKNLAIVIEEKRQISMTANAQTAQLQEARQQIDGLKIKLNEKPKTVTRNIPVPIPIGLNSQGLSEEEKKRRREIREALGDLMRRGVVLRDRVFSDPPDASGKLNEESQKWFDETRKYIIANLGSAYDTQFITMHVEPLARGVPHERESLWHGLNERIEALSKFIDELK